MRFETLGRCQEETAARVVACPLGLRSEPFLPAGAALDELTAEIKRAVDIVAVIGEYIRLDPAGAQYRGLCPFHDDHTPSMVVDPRFQNFRCWACGAKGDVFSFVQQYERINFAEAKQRLADRAGIKIAAMKREGEDPRTELYRVLSWAQQQYASALADARLGDEARRYLADRQLSFETAARFGLGWAPPHYEWLSFQAKKAGIAPDLLGKAGLTKTGNRATPYDVFRGRLMFPIRDERGRVLGFGGRVLPAYDDGKAPKYLNTPATEVYHKSLVLYGLDVALPALSRPGPQGRLLTVMEGYTDCLMAYQAGFFTAVATCGTALTPQHVAKLRTVADGVVLTFDGDAAGVKATVDAVNLFLSSELDVRICILPEGKDPCDFVRDHGIEPFRDQLARAPDAFDYLVSQVRGADGAQTLEGKRQAIERVLRVLSKVPEVPRKSQAVKMELALSRLRNLFGVDEVSLRRRMSELRQTAASLPRAEEVAKRSNGPRAELRERQIAQWLIARPECLHELRPWLDNETLRDPDLRTLVSVLCELFDRLGKVPTIDQLRESLPDPLLDHYVIDFLDSAPSGEEFLRGLEDIKSSLEKRKRRAAAGGVADRLDAAASVHQHLDVLRQFRKPSAL